MGAKAAAGPSARERLLEAANELFYDEGVHTVGIDRVIERAGVAKASLYNSFGSKDELVRAYLEKRHERVASRITRYLERYSDPRERLLGVFEAQGELFVEQGFRGCAFVSASAESPARPCPACPTTTGAGCAACLPPWPARRGCQNRRSWRGSCT